jgi:methionyl aminopeptidase
VLRHGAITLKSSEEIECMAAAGAIVAQALRAAELAARQGARTRDLNEAARAVIAANVSADRKAVPAFLNYPNPNGGKPFPGVCCTSVNDEVVHGMPGDRVLVDGDVVAIDVGVSLDGWCADAATTIVVGARAADDAKRAFVADSWRVLDGAIAMMQPGAKWSDIASRMQITAVEAGLGIIDGWMGHGIGRTVHEAPQVPCMVSPGLRERRDFTLLPGMVLAVEPLLVQGGGSAIQADGCARSVPVLMRDDGWTVVTATGQIAAHVEHTVAITRQGPRVLTAHSTDSTLVSSNGGARR